jgi:hypothetical protein
VRVSEEPPADEPGREGKPGRRRWRTRLRGPLLGPTAKLVLRTAHERGPLRTVRLFFTGELGVPGTTTTAMFLYLNGPQSLWLWQLYLLVVLAPPLLGLVVLVTINSLLVTGSTEVQVTLVVAMFALAMGAGALVYLLALRPTRGRVLGLVRSWGWEDLAWWAMFVVMMPTVAFAVAAAVLVHHELIASKGPTTDAWLAFRTFETFAWNFADAVPVLKVPETLHWKPELELTSMTGGALVLAYKLLLVLPLVQLAAIALTRTFGADKPDEPDRPGGE